MLCFDVCVSILHCVVIYIDLEHCKRLMTWMDSYSRQNLLPLINVIYTLYMLFKYPIDKRLMYVCLKHLVTMMDFIFQTELFPFVNV